MNNAKYGLISKMQKYKKRKKYETFASEKIRIILIVINSIRMPANIFDIKRIDCPTFVSEYKRAATVKGKIAIPSALKYSRRLR
jgi:hypothetical protein